MKASQVCVVALLAASPFAPAAAETLLERGDYLINSVVACGNCHSMPNAPDQELAGRFPITTPVFTAHPANITPDPDTGIGNWTENEIVTAIREGKRPDGTIIGPPMAFALYRQMSDTDVRAIAAYLKSVPAVRYEVPKSEYKIPLPESYGPPVGSVPDVERGVTVEYGEYLVKIAHCMECHTPMVKGHIDFENQLGAGGREFEGPWKVSVSANLTSHATDGIAEYSDDDLIKMITTGTRPDGTKMLPPMGYHYYARITPEDLKAIAAYLRSLPPKPDPS